VCLCVCVCVCVSVVDSEELFIIVLLTGSGPQSVGSSRSTVTRLRTAAAVRV
jgi:hypothetical protein